MYDHTLIAWMGKDAAAVKCSSDPRTNGVGDFVGSNSTAQQTKDGNYLCYKCMEQFDLTGITKAGI